MTFWERAAAVALMASSLVMFVVGFNVGQTHERKWPTPEPHVETCELPLPPR